MLNIFENDNGHKYFIIAGDDMRALLRQMDGSKQYVIARGLDWKNCFWDAGQYFDDFEAAVKVFLEVK